MTEEKLTDETVAEEEVETEEEKKEKAEKKSLDDFWDGVEFPATKVKVRNAGEDYICEACQ